MPSESAEVVRRQFAAFADGGLDAVAAFWHPDIEWRAVEGAADDVGPIRGQAALRSYYQDWLDSLDDLSAELEEVLAEDGDRVAVTMRNSGRGRASGVVIDGPLPRRLHGPRRPDRQRARVRDARRSDRSD